MKTQPHSFWDNLQAVIQALLLASLFLGPFLFSGKAEASWDVVLEPTGVFSSHYILTDSAEYTRYCKISVYRDGEGIMIFAKDSNGVAKTQFSKAEVIGDENEAIIYLWDNPEPLRQVCIPEISMLPLGIQAKFRGFLGIGTQPTVYEIKRAQLEPFVPF